MRDWIQERQFLLAIDRKEILHSHWLLPHLRVVEPISNFGSMISNFCMASILGDVPL